MTEFIIIAPEPIFLGTVIAAIALILAALYFFQRSLRHTRLMEDMPTSRIRSAAQGYVELEGRGKMMAGEPVLAPLSHQACVWWKFRVSERYKDTHGRSHMRTIDSGQSDALFLLNDGTGECIVDPDGAEVLHVPKHSWHGSTRMPSAGRMHSTFSLFAKYRYEEWLIKSGHPVYAIGYFRTQQAAGHFSVQEELNELLREWKQDQQLMLQRFDINKDGRIDATEWEAARRVALKQAHRNQLEQDTLPGLHVLSSPPDRRPFLISAMSQDKLIARKRLYAVISLITFLGMIGLVTWAWNLRH